MMKGIRWHTYYSDILKVMKGASSARADCLLTLGAGSLADAAKVVLLALANNAITPKESET